MTKWINNIKKDPLIIINVIIILGVLFIFALALMGSTHNEEIHQVGIYNKIMPECAIKRHTTIDCPSCGLTRGFYTVFDGHVLGGFKYNVLTYPAIALFLVLLVNSLLYLIKGAYSKVVLKILFIVIGIMVATYLWNFYRFIVQYIEMVT